MGRPRSCPSLPHLYLTSSRDESIDKALRLIRCTRKRAQVAIGLDGGYYGHTTAAARSLSDPAVHRQGPGHFDWPRVPHPAVVGSEATDRGAARRGRRGGRAGAVLGFVYEVVQERTGRVHPGRLLAARWRALRDELGVPLVAVETTTRLLSLRPRAVRVDRRAGCVPDVLDVVGRRPDRLPARRHRAGASASR